MIECKNEDFYAWRREIEEQVIPYVEKYKPHKMVLESMKTVPQKAKNDIEHVGINVIDNLSPGNQSAITSFKEICKKFLG